MANERMPALFVGHGAPFNLLSDNVYVRAWRQLGETLPTPKAILVVSAHWLTRGKSLLTAMPQPRTIHDFGGMDPRLYAMQYPAPGAPVLAQRIVERLNLPTVGLDKAWGLDHGSWCVLRVMYPAATIPVLQLSLDAAKSTAEHYELAQQLAFLRREGVLIIGSGNIVHNLRLMTRPEQQRLAWAERFDRLVCEHIATKNHQPLLTYAQFGEDAALSIPTPEHYWPLLYVLGVQEADDKVSYPLEGFAFGSISMRALLLQS